MNTIECICKNIDENPTDKLLWGILADAMEEAGDERCVGMRWLLENVKSPLGDISSKEWTWFSQSIFGKAPEDIPDEMLEQMEGYFSLEKFGESWKDYHTLSEAMLAAAKAYVIYLEKENAPDHSTSS